MVAAFPRRRRTFELLTGRRLWIAQLIGMAAALGVGAALVALCLVGLLVDRLVHRAFAGWRLVFFYALPAGFLAMLIWLECARIVRAFDRRPALFVTAREVVWRRRLARSRRVRRKDVRAVGVLAVGRRDVALIIVAPGKTVVVRERFTVPLPEVARRLATMLGATAGRWRIADLRRLRGLARGPICMRCGYSLAGLSAHRCPECGNSY